MQTWVVGEVYTGKEWETLVPQEHFIIHFIVCTKHLVVHTVKFCYFDGLNMV